MKDTLIEYYTFIFVILHIKRKFEVYECNKNEFSFWRRKFDRLYNYIVIYQLNIFDKKNIGTETIKILKDWHSGVDNNDYLTPPVSEICLPKKVSFFSPVHSPKNMILPDWIDTYLFNNLNIKYMPDCT